MHSFLGNERTNASTTTGDLFAFTASSCLPVEDHSAYWIPTLYDRGRAVEPKAVTVYYGSLLPDKTQTVPFPQGFRMIAGDAKRQVPTPQGAVNQLDRQVRGRVPDRHPRRHARDRLPHDRDRGRRPGPPGEGLCRAGGAVQHSRRFLS
jgi:hypothetical protein